MSLDQGTDFVKQQTPTRDAFLGGRLVLAQPRAGFRAGLDSVLLGAAVSAGRQRLLDLGSGVGTAALVALADDERLGALLAERDPGLAGLARENIERNGFAGRAAVAEIDITAPGREREAAGLRRDHFDAVIANPPFYGAGAGTHAPEPSRAGARHMAPEALELWVRTAAAAARPGGEAIFIHLASALPSLLAAFAGRFGAVSILPLAPRAGDAASRVLLRGIKGSRAPLTLLPPLVLHQGDGHDFVPEVKAIFMGRARLVW